MDSGQKPPELKAFFAPASIAIVCDATHRPDTQT
jgi:hypothetical protein